MIDFRYHLVSIVAIFLALSVGIVLGTVFFQEPAIDLAKQTVEQVRQRNTDLQTEIDTLKRREGGNDEFIGTHAAQLVQGALTGERVVIVEPPGVTAALRDAMQQALTQAGAAVSGRVAITEKYLDPKQTGLVDQLAMAAKPAEMTFPEDATPYDKAAAVLSAAVVTGDSAQGGRENPAAAGALDAFQKGSLITMSGAPSQRATLAVMMAPADPYEGDNADVQNDAIVALAAGLDGADGGTLIVGTEAAAGAGGLITALRDSDEAADTVSSVDTADLPMGRVVAVYALREQLAGDSGHYGVGPMASAVEPSPSPSSTPSSSGG
ncbi:copper transporter [Streptosporangium sp. KLBMP 9127]|nr:copper transporter [Streptosporangium sp. KLBMP 9127]